MDQKPAAKSVEVDVQQFKTGMRSLAGAVNIITSAQAGHRYGMTAPAVCSGGADPPTVLVCVNKLATTHGAILKSKVFCANVLRSDDWELSTSFSGAQSGESRFKAGAWTKLITGSPVLIDALVSFDCRVVNKIAHGTHTIFLGQVEQVLLGVAFLLENVSRGMLAPFFGALSDRVGRRPLLLVSSLATAAVLPCFLLVQGPVSLIAWSLALGVTGAVNMPVAGALLLDLAPPERRQAVLAANYTGMSVAYTLGVMPAGFAAGAGYRLLASLSCAGYLCVAPLYSLALRRALPPQRARR